MRDLVDGLKGEINADEAYPCDRGSWDGRWGMPSRTEWGARNRLGFSWPSGAQEINAVQTARKEYHWSSMSPSEKTEFETAAKKGWDVWVENDAVEILSDDEAQQVRARLKRDNEGAKILTPRWVSLTKTMDFERMMRDCLCGSRLQGHFVLYLAEGCPDSKSNFSAFPASPVCLMFLRWLAIGFC